MKDHLIGLLVRHSLAVMLVNLLLLAAIAFGMSNLTIQSGMKIFFGENDPNLLAQEKLEEIYGKPDNILFVLDAGQNDMLSREALAALEWLTKEAWQIPHSRRVDSIANYQYPLVDGDDIIIEELVNDAEALIDEQLARIREIVLNDKLILGRLISSDGRVVAVNVTLGIPEDRKAAAVAESVTFARSLKVAVAKRLPSVEIYLAGWAVTEQSLVEVTENDKTGLFPLLFLTVVVLLAMCLRSISASLITLVAIVLSVLTGMGFAGWAGIQLNSVNVAAPTIIMTLAVADCVHVFSVFLTRLRVTGNKINALQESLASTVYPVFLTSITTALGFLSMNLSESPPFRDLGTISAIGVLGALWVTVTMLPGLVMCTPFKRATQAPNISLDWLSRAVINHRNVVFYCSLGAIVVVASFLTRIELNDDPAEYFSKDVQITRAISVVESKLSGTQSIQYAIDTGLDSGVMEPAFLQQVDAFTAWLRTQPEVTNVEVFTDTLKRLNQVLHADAKEWNRIPDSRPLAAQYTLMYEMSVPYGLDLSNQVSVDKSSLKLTVTLKNQKSVGLLAFEARSKNWREENTPAIATHGAGASISFAHIGLRNIETMLFGVVIALVLISFCLTMAFRSIRWGLLSLVPNLFPALVALGIWAALVGEVNIAASVVFSLTLGIIVDDTTHFLLKYKEIRKMPGVNAEQAISYAFSNVGSALVTTSIVLIAGFLVLVWSDFSVNATSGLLVAITIFVAIILDLTFLPALLLKVEKWLPSEPNGSAAK